MLYNVRTQISLIYVLLGECDFIMKKKDDRYGDHYRYYQGKNSEYVDISSGSRRGPKRKFPWLRVFSILFFSILGTVGGLMIYVYNTLNSVNYDDLSDEQHPSAASEPEDTYLNDSMILNVLLLGTDTRSDSDNGRSDSTMLISLDLKHKKIKITSLMRDIWVQIPGYHKDRLNAAYSYGGAKLAIKTIEHNFGVHIDRYASVDFNGFAKIIDALGGVDMKLTDKEIAYVNSDSQSPTKIVGTGVVHLNGLQTLSHARNRHSAGSDYDRTQRQRNVMIAVIEKFKTASIPQITKAISDVAPLITTNFKTSEITKLASNVASYSKFTNEEFRLPTNDNVRNETIDQKMVLVINDMTKAKYDLAKFIYEDSIEK